MKKVLITGGSHAEIPLIDAAHEMGCYVVTTGNNVEGLGHKKADKYIAGDFSDKNFVYELAENEKVDAIISGCNDFAYLSAAYACEKLNLKGHDKYSVAETIHHKDLFIECLKRNNIPCPQIEKCETKDELNFLCHKIGFPILVKPIDLTGGKGVRICANLAEAIDAYEEAMKCTRENYVVVEEFVRGTNHGVSVLLRKQKVVVAFIDEEQYGENKYLVAGACTIHDKMYDDIKAKIIPDIEKLAKCLQLSDGLFHSQFILNAQNYPIMIDPCRRAPGDLYIEMAKLSTGVNYAEQIVKSEMGIELEINVPNSRHYIARECIMTNHIGKIKNIIIDKEVSKYIVKQMIWAKEGDVVDDCLKYKAGILIMEFPTYSQMKQIVKQFSDLVRIEFE